MTDAKPIPPDDAQPAAFPRQTITGTGANGNIPTFFVTGDIVGPLPPITVSAWLDGAHIQTYLTADEAALLGKTLLDAATAVQRAQITEDIVTLSMAARRPAEGQGAA